MHVPNPAASLTRKFYAVKHAFSSKEAWRDFIETERTYDIDGKENRWMNEDLKPTPPEKQTWSWYNWLVFYWSVGFGNWTLGSTMIGIGLSWWQSIVVIFVSQLIASVAMFFNSRSGATYHVGYPCVARSVFGMWGSYYVVAARAILAVVWYAVQIYSGASLMDCMLRAIFGNSYYNMPNHIASSQGISSRRLMCFFLLWCAHLAMNALRPYQLNKFFWCKSFFVTPAIIGLFAFCMIETKGDLGPLFPATTSGGSFFWYFMYAINAGMGNNATYITNQPDMTRWSKSLKACQWTQIFANVPSTTLSATFGILATSAINAQWDLDLWNQWDLMNAILDHYWNPGARFAIALCAFAWTFYFLGVNVSSNALPFGSDATMLLPKYLTIPRGQFLATFLTWGLVPWKIEASASVFVTFLSGYGIFMASVAAVMMCEYYLLTNGNIFLGNVYDGSKNNKHYRYRGGWNIQAYAAYIIGVAPPLPGFIQTLGADISTAALDIGHLGWCLSFILSFIAYYLICKVWPTENQRIIKELGLGWEQLAKSPDNIESIDGVSVTPVETIVEEIDGKGVKSA